MIFGLGGKKKSVRKAKPAKKAAGKRKAFGGYAISFAGRKETLEELFGKKPIGPSVMTKVLWKFVKAKRLGGKH